LRLAQSIGEQETRPAGFPVVAPPVVNVGHHDRLCRPAVDRQAKSRFGDKGMTAHWLEGRAGWVGLEFVISRDHPDFTPMLDADLGRAEDMPGRVQRDRTSPRTTVSP